MVAAGCCQSGSAAFQVLQNFFDSDGLSATAEAVAVWMPVAGVDASSQCGCWPEAPAFAGIRGNSQAVAGPIGSRKNDWQGAFGKTRGVQAIDCGQGGLSDECVESGIFRSFGCGSVHRFRGQTNRNETGRTAKLPATACKGPAVTGSVNSSGTHSVTRTNCQANILTSDRWRFRGSRKRAPQDFALVVAGNPAAKVDL